jgi:hypothetical protein
MHGTPHSPVQIKALPEAAEMAGDATSASSIYSAFALRACRRGPLIQLRLSSALPR